MKKSISICLLLFSVSAFLVATTHNRDALKIGDTAPLADQTVEDISGRSLTLNEVAEENGLLVIFTCNTCPWVSKWEDRYNPIANQAKDNNIGVISLNPNESIRNRGESMDDMRARAKKMKYDFFYALDKDHKLADAFGATRTPEVFLFDNNMKLVYHGAIDDNANSATSVEEAYLSNAMNELVSGEAIGKTETRSLGCTIKRSR